MTEKSASSHYFHVLAIGSKTPRYTRYHVLAVGLKNLALSFTANGAAEKAGRPKHVSRENKRA